MVKKKREEGFCCQHKSHSHSFLFFRNTLLFLFSAASSITFPPLLPVLLLLSSLQHFSLLLLPLLSFLAQKAIRAVRVNQWKSKSGLRKEREEEEEDAEIRFQSLPSLFLPFSTFSLPAFSELLLPTFALLNYFIPSIRAMK